MTTTPTTVDGPGSNSDAHVLRFNEQVHFVTTRDLNLGTLFELFCERMGADLGAVSFLHKVRVH